MLLKFVLVQYLLANIVVQHSSLQKTMYRSLKLIALCVASADKLFSEKMRLLLTELNLCVLNTAKKDIRISHDCLVLVTKIST